MSDNGSDKSPRRHNGGSGGAKNALGVVAGAGAGGFLGHEILGGGVVGTVSGMLVGAIGAQALERRHERYGFRFLLPLSDCVPFLVFSVFLFLGAGREWAELCPRKRHTLTLLPPELDIRKPAAHRLETGSAEATANAKKG